MRYEQPSVPRARLILTGCHQEEDFVTNTYHRNLLDSFSRDAVQQVIKNTSARLQACADSVPPNLLQALNDRLLLRYVFLAAIEQLQYRTDPDLIRSPWEEAVGLLRGIKDTHLLSKPVPEAFSAKLQRRLASTMPPRPIVELSFDDAFSHLSRLLQDGVEVIDVLKYTDSQCLQVCLVASCLLYKFADEGPRPLS